MPIPAANQGGTVQVTVLTDKYNKSYLPEPANGESPVKQRWFNGGDVETIVIKPEIKRTGIPDPVAPKPTEINIRNFFPGGVS